METRLHRSVPPAHLPPMEYRQLGHSGLKVPVLSFGTGTFGGRRILQRLGQHRRQRSHPPDRHLPRSGVNLFDTADVYSQGDSEEILGKAIGRPPRLRPHFHQSHIHHGRRPQRSRLLAPSLIEACEASLRRLNTDYIDIYHMHGFDAQTPVDEVLKTLDTLVQAAKSATSPARISPDGIS